MRIRKMVIGMAEQCRMINDEMELRSNTQPEREKNARDGNTQFHGSSIYSPLAEKQTK